MTDLDDALRRLQGYDGVERVLLLGRDGLLIRQSGHREPFDAETVSAMVPGLSTACAALGRASGRGDFATAVIEFTAGIVIVAPLPKDLLVAVVLRSGVGFAPLLRVLRGERDALAGLL